MAIESSVNYFVNYLKKPVFLAALICIIIFYSGFFYIPDKTKPRSLIKPEQITAISGTILSSPSKTGNGSYYSASFSLENAADARRFQSSAKGRITIMLPSEIAEAYSPGKLFSQSQKARGRDRNWSQGRGGEQQAAHAFLYEAGGHCDFRGRFSNNTFYVRECTASFWPRTFRGRLRHFRALCRLQFKRLMYGWGSGGGLLLALLCGAREYTEPETQDAFRRAGLSHILALSGMHLSMFSAIAVFFGNRAGIRKLTFVLRIITLIGFVWFAGFSPSLVRAFICALLTIAATIAGAKKPDLLSILCFSFLLQSALCPQDIHSTAFLLSYGALAGILLTSSLFSRFYSKFSPKPLASSLSAATGAQTFTAPISLKLFGSFSPIGIVSATVVSPFVTFFIYSGLVLIVLSLIFPILSKPSGIFINLQYTVITYIVKIFSNVPNFCLPGEL